MNASAVSDACRNAEINGVKNCRFICSKVRSAFFPPHSWSNYVMVTGKKLCEKFIDSNGIIIYGIGKGENLYKVPYIFATSSLIET